LVLRCTNLYTGLFDDVATQMRWFVDYSVHKIACRQFLLGRSQKCLSATAEAFRCRSAQSLLPRLIISNSFGGLPVDDAPHQVMAGWIVGGSPARLHECGFMSRDQPPRAFASQ
jgi:hypothetical protein